MFVCFYMSWLHGLKYVVVATGTGATGVKVAEAFKGTRVKVVAVTGYAGAVELNKENIKRIRELGGEVVTSMHVLLGVEDSLSKLYPDTAQGTPLSRRPLGGSPRGRR
jgi:hypothetical protein